MLLCLVVLAVPACARAELERARSGYADYPGSRAFNDTAAFIAGFRSPGLFVHRLASAPEYLAYRKRSTRRGALRADNLRNIEDWRARNLEGEMLFSSIRSRSHILNARVLPDARNT
jgi:hypothetical protein